MTAQVLVRYRGHRSRFGRVLFGDGATMSPDLAHAVAAELRGRGHVAEVKEDRPGLLASDDSTGQLSLWRRT